MSVDDLFSRPSSGSFPKLEDIEGQLMLIKPDKIETVPNKFAKTAEDKQFVERAEADVTIFEDGGGYEEYNGMYLSQQVLISACKNALKPGAKPMVLGRLVKVATKDSREKLKIGESAEDYATARAAWLKGGGKGPEPKHVWILQDFSDEDADMVRKYLNSKAPFAAAAE